jgi:DNA invertase Pin-like site-specific DNA recombinase
MTDMNEQRRAKFVAYYRVKSVRQGRSDAKLDAQRKAVTTYLDGGAWELVGEFTEIESGRQSQRPELAKALDACRKQRARLVIANLNRLSRSPAFIAKLMDSDVEFVAADNPHANRFTIHTLAAVAQHRREMISERTKAGLAAAMASGKKLGTRDPKGAVKRMAQARKAKAEQFAARVLPMIRAIKALGFTSNAAIAAQLNARNVPTARGKEWTHVQVGQVRSVSLGLGSHFAASVLPMIRAIEALGFTNNAAIAEQLNVRNVPTPRGKKWTSIQVGRVRSRNSGLRA